MRIAGPNATARLANASGPRRSAAGGFSVDEGETSKPAAQTTSLRTIGGIDALLAL